MGMMPSEVAELPTLSEELVVSNLGKYWDVEEDTVSRDGGLGSNLKEGVKGWMHDHELANC